jgi:uncharacterized protein (DUF2267 family)
MANLDVEEFLRRVQTRADLSYADARQATDAVLSILGDRISGGEAHDLADALPKEIASSLAAKATEQEAEGFSGDEFYARVGTQLDTSQDKAHRITQAVLSVVADSITRDERKDAQAQVPSSLKPLLDVGQGRR